MPARPVFDLDTLLDGTPFRAVTRLGSGGMGDIYEAVDPFGGRPVVVKILRPELGENSEAAFRMQREAELLKLFSHRNIVRTHGHGTTSHGRPYLVLERIEGCTLRDELKRRGSLPLAEAVDYTRQVLAALQIVHGAGIVHRDVKPSNVMLSSVDGAMRITLIDFGVAKVFAHPQSADAGPPADGLAGLQRFATREGVCVGTPRYVSPEQAVGLDVDRRTDIYAAGLVLYTLVAGRGPFDDIAGFRGLLDAHIATEPPPPSSFAKQAIPTSLEAVILRAIAKRPNDRFVSAEAFSRELGRVRREIREGRSGGRSRRPIARPKPYPRRSAGDPCLARVVRVPTLRDRYGIARPSKAAPAIALPPSKLGDCRSNFSHRGVAYSAAVFFAVASGLAMWFVR